MIIADENIDFGLFVMLREAGFEILSIAEKFPAKDDRDILEIVKSINGILITEDKDFGEWVFAHNIQNVNIIFLRYEKEDFVKVVENVKNVLPRLVTEARHKFVVITKSKIRIREI